MPQLCINLVLLAANIMMRLQGIVAREVDPQDAAVMTVGILQAGHSENVIADQAILKVDIRTQKDETRTRVLKAVKRAVEKVCDVSCAILVLEILIFTREYMRRSTKMALLFSSFLSLDCFSRLAPCFSRAIRFTCC
jgi:metal-dependent amidase/aminoacylase/carboxypeptidase family protein